MSSECANVLTISHDDPTVINRIARAYERKKLFDEFIPWKDQKCLTILKAKFRRSKD